MLRCSKRGRPRKSAHAGKAGLKAREKASFCRGIDDTRCDPRKGRAISRARVECCNAKSCDVPQASVAICERSPLVDGVALRVAIEAQPLASMAVAFPDRLSLGTLLAAGLG